MPPVKKSTVKATRSAKVVTKKPTVKKTVTEQTPLPPTKPKKHIKIQTAEGWKRSMLKKKKVTKTVK